MVRPRLRSNFAQNQTRHNPMGRFWFTRLVTAFLVVAAPFVVLSRSTPTVSAVWYGGGSYKVMASVFGIPDDGLVGEDTSSGHTLAPFDRLVALPACTESSCPWVDLGTGPEGQWGPQTTCAESDGLCWVEVTSLDTGGCTVAPVLDRGPLFVRDNWWDYSTDREYKLERGLPAAEAARDGADLGFGPGKSDRGYDVQHVYDYAAAIDLAAGTWVDLGLDIDQGIGEVEVRLLWQTGISHWDACGAFGNASTVDQVNLRAGPSTSDDILDSLAEGSRVGIIGGMENGFYPVVRPGMTGWVFADYVRPDGGGVGDPVGVVTERVNLRAGPSTADDVIRRMPAGTLVILTGDKENGYYSVSFDGDDGWAYGDYLDVGDGVSGGGGGGGGGGGSSSGASHATTMEALNLRAGPSTNDTVLRVIPPDEQVTLTGKEQHGFFSVSYQGTKGWCFGDYLSTVRRVTESLNLRRGPSTADDVILVMGPGARVAIIGEEQNGFVEVRYHGREGWAYTAYLS